MIKSIEIFAPEDVEFDLRPLGLGKYYMPGDIPTERVLKLLALEKKLRNEVPADKVEAGRAGEEILSDMRDLVVELFSERHSQEELNQLRDGLGFYAMMQIISAAYSQVLEARDDAKNATARAKQEARENNQNQGK